MPESTRVPPGETSLLMCDARSISTFARMLASTACGSWSMASTCRAPSLSAAIPRMPEPQPKSITSSLSGGWASSDSRHSAVVGWVPVPKARPGSRSTIAASGLASSIWPPGRIHRCSPKRMGVRRSSHVCFQLQSSRTSILSASRFVCLRTIEYGAQVIDIGIAGCRFK